MAKNFIQFNNDRQRELAKEEREERIGKLLEKTWSNPDWEPKIFMQWEIQEPKEITIDLNPLAKKFPIIPEEAGKLGKQLWEVLDDQEKIKNKVLKKIKELYKDSKNILEKYNSSITLDSVNWYKITITDSIIKIKSETEKITVIVTIDSSAIIWSKFDWKIFLEKDAVKIAQKALWIK